MEDLFENFTERRLTSSEVFSISEDLVSKSIKDCKDLAWVNVAKNLLKQMNKQSDVHLAHNIFNFIEISVKFEVKSCMSASAKLNRKIWPQINDLLSYIHSTADADLYPSLSKSELDISSLKATLLAAVIDLKVKGVRNGDENALVSDLYTKLTTMFESSMETLCDCLLLCRCLVYKNQRKPIVLIPLLRRVILCSTSRYGRFHCTSPMHYIKLLLLAKILLFMVETNEVVAVHSLIARILRVPNFFRDWLDQNNFPWLSQIDKKHINIKNILKCMKVSTVLETLYGANKVRSEEITTKKNKELTLMESDGLENLSNKCPFKKKKSQLEVQNNGAGMISNKTNYENKISSKTKKKEILRNSNRKELQNDDANQERKKKNTKSEEKVFDHNLTSNIELNGITTIFTPHSSKLSSPSNNKQKGKMKRSPLDLQKGLKRSLLEEGMINHRKRVRRDSLKFSVTNFIEESVAPVKKEVKNILNQNKGVCKSKVSIGIQTDDSCFNESEYDIKIQSEITESTIKSVEIDNDYKVLKPKIDLAGSHEMSKMQVARLDNSEVLVSNNNNNIIQIDKLINYNEVCTSPRLDKLNYSSIQNIIEESVSNIEVTEGFVLNSSSNDNSKMFTGENPNYHKRLLEKEKSENEAIGQHIAHAVQRKEENNIQDQMKKLSIIKKEISTPERIKKNYINTTEESKFDSNETKLYFEENENELVSNNEKLCNNEDDNVLFPNIKSDNRVRNSNKGFCDVFTSLGGMHLKKNGSQIQNVDKRILFNENKSEIEVQSLNHESVADQCNLKETVSKHISKSSSESNINESEEEMLKASKISANESENNYEMIKEENISTKINSKYNGSELEEDTAEGQITKANQNGNILDSEYDKINKSQEVDRNIALAEFQIENMNISEKDAVNTQVNKDYSIVLKGKIDIGENEELEVLSTSGVKGDFGENVSIGSCANSRDSLAISQQQVSNDTVDMHSKSSAQCLSSSKIQGKIMTHIDNASGIKELKQESPRILKENTIVQSVSCNMKNQSQMKVNGTLSSTTSSEDLQRQDLTINISKENSQNKKQTTDMNDSFKNKMNKTDKKNEKLKVGENYGRINYLVQASRKVFNYDESISSQLGSLAISFGRRLPQVRLDPLLKREMCKGCGVYLVYGVNAKVRHKSKRQKHLVITCLTCHTIKRFVTNPKHKLWSEQPEAKV